MAMVLDLPKIKAALAGYDPIASMAEGFAAYSRGEVVVPPVGELLFDHPKGDAHIKYGYIKGDEHFVVKVATGFYDNPKMGLPGNSGLMLVFSQKTGFLDAVLLDEGYLTNLRTAAAGALAAKLLAPREISAIGVFGTGLQARMQCELLRGVTSCRELIAWGRNPKALAQYRTDMQQLGFSVQTTEQVADVARNANLLVCTTAAETPYLLAEHLRPGTHITAMGSDTPQKNEVDARALGRCQLLVADSRGQCLERGELHHGVRAGTVAAANVVELGEIVSDSAKGRRNEADITLADLTGVAVQDIQIAKAVLAAIAAA